jgi:hypothetical protein
MRGGGGLDLATHGNSLSANVSVRRSIYPPCPADGCEGRSGQSSCCRSGSSRASPACLPHAPGSPATRGAQQLRSAARHRPCMAALLSSGGMLAGGRPRVPSPCCPPAAGSSSPRPSRALALLPRRLTARALRPSYPVVGCFCRAACCSPGPASQLQCSSARLLSRTRA